MRHVTTALDIAALALIAAGIGAAFWPLIGLACLAVSGLVLGLGSWMSESRHR